ncbi:MAG: hypothetical protein LBI62_00955 [Candidatus Accumulibacter sp.]|jgi:conjugal transfer/type IV secretion protein DotA/TraY|nr:hypothetical protein [Accumulibacter sp.]
MKGFGDTIVTTGEVLMMTLASVAGASNSWISQAVVKVGFDANAALQMIAGVLAFMMLGLFIFGVTLSTYTPLIPFITWVASVINWFVLLIEAVLAAPIWASIRTATTRWVGAVRGIS